MGLTLVIRLRQQLRRVTPVSGRFGHFSTLLTLSLSRGPLVDLLENRDASLPWDTQGLLGLRHAGCPSLELDVAYRSLRLEVAPVLISISHTLNDRKS